MNLSINHRKIVSISVVVLVIALLTLPYFVLAGNVDFKNPINKKSVSEVVKAFLEFITKLGAVLSVLFVVFAGFLFVTARGNESQLAKAKIALLWTMVGALITLGAFVLARIIENTAKQFGVGGA